MEQRVLELTALRAELAAKLEEVDRELGGLRVEKAKEELFCEVDADLGRPAALFSRRISVGVDMVQDPYSEDLSISFDRKSLYRAWRTECRSGSIPNYANIVEFLKEGEGACALDVLYYAIRAVGWGEDRYVPEEFYSVRALLLGSGPEKQGVLGEVRTNVIVNYSRLVTKTCVCAIGLARYRSELKVRVELNKLGLAAPEIACVCGRLLCGPYEGWADPMEQAAPSDMQPKPYVKQYGGPVDTPWAVSSDAWAEFPQ